MTGWSPRKGSCDAASISRRFPSSTATTASAPESPLQTIAISTAAQCRLQSHVKISRYLHRLFSSFHHQCRLRPRHNPPRWCLLRCCCCLKNTDATSQLTANCIHNYAWSRSPRTACVDITLLVLSSHYNLPFYHCLFPRSRPLTPL